MTAEGIRYFPIIFVLLSGNTIRPRASGFFKTRQTGLFLSTQNVKECC